MLMKRVRLINNSCSSAGLVGGHFNLHIDGYATVDSEMRSSEYAANSVKFSASHPFVAITVLDEYENGDVDLTVGAGGFKYGDTDLI